GGWFDYFTGTYYEGGRIIEADAPLDKIPVFVKDGSIIPVAVNFDRDTANGEDPGTVCTGKKTGLEIFAKKDASYIFYDDAGDGYDYEKGAYRTIRLSWDHSAERLNTEVMHDMPGEKIPAFEVTRICK
ncbi:MAG: DUF5110 domain-containing protein, partial [Lachnospiraceae bacterium]|nr:DUF5110 domain-containing protein [Lachnospiraceae bacterium]